VKLLSAAATLFLAATVQTAAAQDNPWVLFTDPHEHAFTIEVPRGWQATGGIMRRSALQPYSVVMLRSPGGATQMILGDSNAITYTTMTLLRMQLRFHEGMMVDGGGEPMWILNYRSGQQFAAIYGERLLAQQCQNVRLTTTRNRPEAVTRPPQSYAGVPTTAMAGDAFFTCERDGHKFEAYFFSQTNMTGDPQKGAIWNAQNTFGFIAPEGRGMAAGIIVAHIIGSAKTDQAWLAQQLKVAGDVARATAVRADAQLAETAQSISSTFAQTQHDASATQEEFGRLISGFDEYQTASGDTKTVPYATASNWWSNSKGQTVGTQGPNAPGLDWQKMTRLPPGGAQ
jgi:hypothetical protein